MEAAVSTPTARRGDHYLDFEGVADKLHELGITDSKTGGKIPANRIRSWADAGKLPFFKGPDGKRRISESALEAALRKMQDEAAKPKRGR